MIDLRVLERPIEELSRRSDERLAGEIFLVARLLADEEHVRVGTPSPKTACVAFR